VKSVRRSVQYARLGENVTPFRLSVLLLYRGGLPVQTGGPPPSLKYKFRGGLRKRGLFALIMAPAIRIITPMSNQPFGPKYEQS
jgi:hypothetical protein